MARSSGAYSDNLDACRFAPAVPWLTGVAPIATNICICICSAVRRPASRRLLTTTSGAASEGLAAREEEEEGEPSAADDGGGEGLGRDCDRPLEDSGGAHVQRVARVRQQQQVGDDVEEAQLDERLDQRGPLRLEALLHQQEELAALLAARA